MTFDALRELGLNLIPCFAKTKEPKVKWTPYKDTKYTGDLGNENAAVICGSTSGNLVVIDIDKPEFIPKYFNDIEAVKASTLVVQTGKGGLHIYCHPKGSMIPVIKMVDSNQIPVGEVRGQGGYVMAPGSIHPNGTKYEIISSVMTINELDIDLFLAHLKQNGITPQSRLPPINEIVKGVPLGNRDNATFKYSAHLLGTVGLDEQTAWIEIQRWAKEIGHNCKPEKLRQTFDSARKRVKPPEPKPIPIAEIKKKLEFPNMKKIREVSSKDEGSDVSFDAYVATLDEYRTVTTSMTTICPNCSLMGEVTGDGYVNPRLPKCPKCKINVIEKRIEETTDMRQILLQEFQEESKNRKPLMLTARVIGLDSFRINMGDRVRVTGKFKSFSESGKKDNQVAILIKHFECLDEPEDEIMEYEDIEAIRDIMDESFIKEKLVPSFAPGLHGLELAKEILLLTLAGGYKMGTVRGDINTLLVGNPSRGKSELMIFFDEVANKCSLVDASTATGAGLVYGMVKMADGTSVPYPGPAITNDGGFCCIDELDKPRDPKIYSQLLQVMQRQKVSFVVAGVDTEANARTTIVAAANPKGGKWDNESSLMDNLNLPQPLVSRNDWIVGIIKTTNMERGMIADHILQNAEKRKDVFFTPNRMKKYFNYIRLLRPIVSEEAAKKLKDFYMKISVKLEEEGMPFEERQLEGLRRASIARAKIMLKDQVTVEDADAVIDLYKKSLQSLNLKVEGDMIQSKFGDSGTIKANKEHSLIKAYALVADENGLVEKSLLFQKMMEVYPKYFHDSFDCENIFKKFEGSRILIDGASGMYRMKL